MRIGNDIREALKLKGKNQRWLATHLKIDQRTLSNKLKRNAFSLNEIFKITSLIDLDLNEIAKEHNSMLNWTVGKNVVFSKGERYYESKVIGIDSEKKLILDTLDAIRLEKEIIKSQKKDIALTEQNNEGETVVNILCSGITHSIYDFDDAVSSLFRKMQTENRLVFHTYSTTPKYCFAQTYEAFRSEAIIKKKKKGKSHVVVTYGIENHNEVLQNLLSTPDELEEEFMFDLWLRDVIKTNQALNNNNQITFEVSQISKEENELLNTLHEIKGSDENIYRGIYDIQWISTERGYS